MAETYEKPYKTPYDRACHGKRCQHEEYQPCCTVAFDEGLIFVGTLSGTFHKTFQRFIGDNVEFMPGAYEERVENEHHNGLDEKVESNQYGCVHLCGDTDGKPCHPSEDDVGGSDTQQLVKRAWKKEGAEQNKQYKAAKQCKSKEQNATLCMAEKRLLMFQKYPFAWIVV
jgi:hypothetical protein